VAVLGVRITRAWRRTLRCWVSSRRYAGRTRVRAPLLPCNCFNYLLQLLQLLRPLRPLQLLHLPYLVHLLRVQPFLVLFLSLSLSLFLFLFNRSCTCPSACRRQRQLLERGGEPRLLVEEFKPVVGHRVDVQDNLPGPAPRHPAGKAAKRPPISHWWSERYSANACCLHSLSLRSLWCAQHVTDRTGSPGMLASLPGSTSGVQIVGHNERPDPGELLPRLF
jgi:hypothetical protein